MKLALRFIGDPTAYIVNCVPDWTPRGWVEAEVGFSGRIVRVDASKAYLAEVLS